MSHNDHLQRSFDRAQRAYDNMMPDEDESVECPDCEGTGMIAESNCCGSKILEPDICAHCKEHTEKSVCDRCDGTGYLDVEKEREKNEPDEPQEEPDDI